MVGKRFFILLVIALFVVAGCGDSETATEGDGDSHLGDGDGEPDPDGDGEPDPDGDGEPDPDGDGDPDQCQEEDPSLQCDTEGCDDGFECVEVADGCGPGDCFCTDNGLWACTDECTTEYSCEEADNGDQCTDEDPSLQCDTEGCDDGFECVEVADGCAPSSCVCEEGSWACTEDCGPEFVCEEEDNSTEPAQCQEDFGEADACGGDPIGSWSFAEVCTDYDIAAAFSAICTGVEVEKMDITGTGTLVITDANFARDTELDIDGEILVPAQCSFGNCDGVETTIESTLNGVEATCVEVGGGPGPQPGDCECELVGTIEESSSGSYTTDDGVIEVENHPTDYYYCVDEASGSMSVRAISTQGEPTFTELYLED